MSERANDVRTKKDFAANIDYLSKSLAIEENFDIIYREMKFVGKKFGMFFVDGFAKDDIVTLVTRALDGLERSEVSPFSLEKLIQKHLHYIEVETEEIMDKVIYAILSGAMAIVVEGADKIIILDNRQYPARQPEEPDLERVIRGSRDGFVETMIANIALIRRRIRDPRMRAKILQAGRRSQTDICILGK